MKMETNNSNTLLNLASQKPDDNTSFHSAKMFISVKNNE